MAFVKSHAVFKNRFRKHSKNGGKGLAFTLASRFRLTFAFDAGFFIPFTPFDFR